MLAVVAAAVAVVVGSRRSLPDPPARSWATGVANTPKNIARLRVTVKSVRSARYSWTDIPAHWIVPTLHAAAAADIPSSTVSSSLSSSSLSSSSNLLVEILSKSLSMCPGTRPSVKCNSRQMVLHKSHACIIMGWLVGGFDWKTTLL